MRLIQGLGWFNDSAGVDFIKQQAQSSLEGPVRNAAIRTIGITQGVNEIEFLSKFLSDPNPQIRLAAFVFVGRGEL
jgi:HEAT repeat protein